MPRRLNLGLGAAAPGNGSNGGAAPAAVLSSAAAATSASPRGPRSTLRHRGAPIRIALGATRPTCAHKNARRRPASNKEASSAGEKGQSGGKNGGAAANRGAASAAAADSRSSSPRGHRILSTCLYYAFLRGALPPASLRSGSARCVRACTYVRTWYTRGTWCKRGIRGRGYTSTASEG